MSGKGGHARAFIANTNGTIGILLGLAMIPLVIAGGMAIDYSRGQSAKLAMMSSLDAASLAVAAALRDDTITVSQAQDRAQKYFDANMAQHAGFSGKIDSVAVTKDKYKTSVTLSAKAEVPTNFVRLIDINYLNVSAQSSAVYESNEVELAMALDVTGSMAGSRITALKGAVQDAVDILIPKGKVVTSTSGQRVRIGFAPYSQGLNAATYAKAATDGLSTDCVTERVGSNMYTDASYSVEPVGNGSTGCPKSTVLPLTDNRDTLIAQISKLEATGYTAGHTGIAWAWYMLSPDWSNLWPSDSKPNAYKGSYTQKIALIMTDGEFNTAYTEMSSSQKNKYCKSMGYPPQCSSWNLLNENKGSATSTAETRATAYCSAMKNKGILIYTVAFQAGSMAEKLLAKCASNSTTAFIASDEEALKAVFKEIADRIVQLRIAG